MHRGGVERGVADRVGAERVEPRRQVAVHAVRLDEARGGLDGLQQGLVRHGGGGRGRRGGYRLVGGDGGGAVRALDHAVEAERLEHALVEAVLALEQLVDAAQERARLGALDHAVVVGRGHRHDLLDAQLLERCRALTAVRPGG